MLKDVTHRRNEPWSRCEQMITNESCIIYTRKLSKSQKLCFPLQILTFSINTFSGAACVVIRFFKKTVRVFTCNIEFTIHKISKTNMNIHIWHTPSCELLTSSKKSSLPTPLPNLSSPQLLSLWEDEALQLGTPPRSYCHRPRRKTTGWLKVMRSSPEVWGFPLGQRHYFPSTRVPDPKGFP